MCREVAPPQHLQAAVLRPTAFFGCAVQSFGFAVAAFLVDANKRIAILQSIVERTVAIRSPTSTASTSNKMTSNVYSTMPTTAPTDSRCPPMTKEFILYRTCKLARSTMVSEVWRVPTRVYVRSDGFESHSSL